MVEKPMVEKPMVGKPKRKKKLNVALLSAAAPLLAHPDPAVRAKTALKARAHRARALLPMLMTRLEFELTPRVIAAILVAVADLGGPEHVPQVASFLLHRHHRVVSAAVLALYRIAGDEAIPLFFTCLHREDRRVQDQALAALVRVCPEQLAGYLRSMVDAPRDELRAAGEAALARIAGSQPLSGPGPLPPAAAAQVVARAAVLAATPRPTRPSPVLPAAPLPAPARARRPWAALAAVLAVAAYAQIAPAPAERRPAVDRACAPIERTHETARPRARRSAPDLAAREGRMSQMIKVGLRHRAIQPELSDDEALAWRRTQLAKLGMDGRYVDLVTHRDGFRLARAAKAKAGELLRAKKPGEAAAAVETGLAALDPKDLLARADLTEVLAGLKERAGDAAGAARTRAALKGLQAQIDEVRRTGRPGRAQGVVTR